MLTAAQSLIQSTEASYRNAFAASEMYDRGNPQAKQMARTTLGLLDRLMALPVEDLPIGFDRRSFDQEIRGEMRLVLQ